MIKEIREVADPMLCAIDSAIWKTDKLLSTDDRKAYRTTREYNDLMKARSLLNALCILPEEIQRQMVSVDSHYEKMFLMNYQKFLDNHADDNPAVIPWSLLHEANICAEAIEKINCELTVIQDMARDIHRDKALFQANIRKTLKVIAGGATIVVISLIGRNLG